MPSKRKLTPVIFQFSERFNASRFQRFRTDGVLGEQVLENAEEHTFFGLHITVKMASHQVMVFLKT